MRSSHEQAMKIGLLILAQLRYVGLLPDGHDGRQPVAIAQLIDALQLAQLSLLLAQNERLGATAKEERFAHLTQQLPHLLYRLIARVLVRRYLHFRYIVDRIEKSQPKKSLLALDLLGQFGHIQPQRIGHNYRLGRTQLTYLLKQDGFHVKVLDNAFDDELSVVHRLFEAAETQYLASEMRTLDHLIGIQLCFVALVFGVDAVERLQIVVIAFDTIAVVGEFARYFNSLLNKLITSSTIYTLYN